METNDHSVQFAGGTLGRHRHICAFFNSLDEQHRVLRSFIKDGFDRGEKALHFVDPKLRGEHLKRLADAGIDVERAMGSGQLEVRLWQDAQLRGNRFDHEIIRRLSPWLRAKRGGRARHSGPSSPGISHVCSAPGFSCSKWCSIFC